MSHMLTEPGFYDVDADDYHADPCAEASLSNSVGKILLDACPRSAYWAHPRLNPQFRRDEETKFDRGNVAHALLLGKGKTFRVIDAADYKGGNAKMLRDAYRAAGLIPILIGHHQIAEGMAAAARIQLTDIDGGKYAFNVEFGEIELCAIARDPVGCWGRTLIDFYGSRCPDGVQRWDYKTTSGTANPAMIGARAEQMGWAFQDAFQERIITTLKPELSGRLPPTKFLVQEDAEPYLCSVVQPDAGARTLAHKKVAAAFAIWKACLDRGQWPGYSRHAVLIGVRSFVEEQWLSRELDDEMVQIAAHDPYLTQAFSHPDPYVRTFGIPIPPAEPITIAHRQTLDAHERAARAEAMADARDREAPIKPRQVRKKRGKYKPAKPDDKRKKRSEPPDGLTNLDAG